jgi:glycopeptide antibiotics resistance protein
MKHYLLNCYLFGQIMYYVLRFIHYRRHSPPLNNNQAFYCYLFGQIMYYVLRFIHYRRHSPPLNNKKMLHDGVYYLVVIK